MLCKQKQNSEYKIKVNNKYINFRSKSIVHIMWIQFTYVKPKQ